MIRFKEVIEIVQEPIKKIRGISESGDYVEIRLKNCSLDIRASKQNGDCMRTLYRQELIKPLTIEEIIKYLGLEFISEEGNYEKKENSID